MTDTMRYPGGEMADLYGHRWEIELGYREIKQTMQLSRLTLRSKKPELVEQELWGVLLAYNLVRYQMIKMAGALKGYWPNQLSFSESCGMVMRMTLQGASRSHPGTDAGYGEHGADGEVTDKKRKSLPEGGEGKAV